jgi:hypothetical protein
MLFRIVLTVAAVCLSACGSDASSDDDGGGAPPDAGTGVSTVSGKLINHSLNRLAAQKTGETADFSGLRLDVVGQDALLAGDVTGLGGGLLDTSGCGAMGGCAFRFGGVDLAGASEGLVARVTDTRTSDPLWVTTETWTLGADDLAALQASGGDFADARAFALSRGAVDAVIAPLLGLDADELMARGLVFGLVYDGVSADGSGAPVAGATVAPSLAGMRVVYPNAMFSAAQSATGGQGVFLAVPDAAGPAASITFAVTPPAGSTATWDATPAVVHAGAVYFLRLYSR